MTKSLFAKPNTWWFIIAGLLALHMFTFPFVIYPQLTDKGPTWLGLDVSWQMTLNYALKNKWIWGKDIIYTYGPLGFLSTRIGLGISRWVYVLFDLFLVVNFFFVFKDFIIGASAKFVAVFMCFLVALILPTYYGGDLSWVLTILTFYWMYKTYKHPAWLNILMPCVLIAICFFLKMNTGLFNLIFLTGHLINCLIFKKISIIKAIASFGATVIFIGIMALALHVAIPDYIHGALEIMKGYNDIMYLTDQVNLQEEFNVSFLFYSLVIIHMALFCWLAYTRRISGLYYIMLSLAYLFLLRKQSVIRSDIQHLMEFLPYAPLVLITGQILDFTQEKVQRFFLHFSLLGILLSLTMVTATRAVELKFLDRFTNKQQYRAFHKNYNLKPFLYQKDKRYIPENILQRIGNNTVDIFPWDTEYIIEHNLNYHPRPVFQSFGAYTPYLQERNYEFYLKDGPKYIIYDYESIDNRMAFNDEPILNLFITKNYTYVDSFYTNEHLRMLLERKSGNPVILEKIKEEIAPLQQEILLNGEATFLKIDASYSSKGKIRSAWLFPAPLHIMCMRPDGYWYDYKTSPNLLKGGIMIDRLITNITDYGNYMRNKEVLQPFLKVKLFVADTLADNYNKSVKIEYYKIK